MRAGPRPPLFSALASHPKSKVPVGAPRPHCPHPDRRPGAHGEPEGRRGRGRCRLPGGFEMQGDSFIPRVSPEGGSPAHAAHGTRPQTVREMKLLYRWMFLLRISEQGPSTRSKRGRSSFTHLSGPRATTVAARGRFSSSAISPGGERQHQGRGARGQSSPRTRSDPEYGPHAGVSPEDLGRRLRLTRSWPVPPRPPRSAGAQDGQPGPSQASHACCGPLLSPLGPWDTGTPRRVRPHPLTEVVRRPETPHLHVLLVGGPALEDGGCALQVPRGHVRAAGWSWGARAGVPEAPREVTGSFLHAPPNLK